MCDHLGFLISRKLKEEIAGKCRHECNAVPVSPQGQVPSVRMASAYLTRSPRSSPKPSRALLHGDACQGLMAFTPAVSKELVLRVATAKPLARATAAMKASAVSTAKPAARHLASSSA